MAASVLEVLITGDATSLKLAFTQATVATQQYAAATKTSSVATNQAAASATAFGQQTARAFQYAKLGALAFAAVSVKSALDFNQEFTRIAAITNVVDEDIAGLRDTVLELSHETAVAPTELAHALYFLASAGLDSSQVLEALDATAHGAAIGLGEAGDLARITANAMNAFQDQGLTATQVMDTLTAALREGTAEPDEFANALGRVLPIADNAGISFQAVAASLATMSNAGLDVNEGVTALRAILQSLVAPTKQTETAFEQMGLTVTDVVASMKGQGLIATLRMISARAKEASGSTGEYNQMMRAAIPNIRGLAGALNLTGQRADKVDQIFTNVLNSTGDMGEAFQTTAESDAFKVKQAMNDIQIAGMQLASATLPLVSSALGFVADNAQLIVNALAALAIVRWVLPFFRQLTVANTQLAASETVAATAAMKQAAALNAVAVSGQRAMFRQSLGLPAVPVFAQGASSSVAAHTLQQQAAAAATATGSFTALSGALKMTGAGIGSMANAAAAQGIPQLLIAMTVAQDADQAFRDFQNYGVKGLAQSLAHSNFTGLLPAGGFMPTLEDPLNFFSDFFPDAGEQEHFEKGLADVNQQLALTGFTAKKQAKIVQAALAEIDAAAPDADNIDDYVDAIQGQIDAVNSAKTMNEQAAAAQLELTKKIQESEQSTRAWQVTTAKMTAHLSGLTRIGIDVESFMAKLQSDLAESDDQAATFTAAIDEVSQAWMDFQAAAAESLNFAPQALADLTSAAEGAQDSLANLAPPDKDLGRQELADYNAELGELQSTANLTGEEILTSFRDAAEQTRSFGKDLLELSRVGGDAGKDLAAALLESGNVLAAQAIADEPKKIQEQIAHAYGASTALSEKFGTQLTDAIVGPLETIQDLLVQLARKAFGVHLKYDDGGVKRKTHETQEELAKIAREHAITMALKDNASGGLRHLNTEVTGLVGTGPHEIVFAANTEAARTKLAAFDDSLDAFLAKKRTVHVGVSTGPNSPWPDEALQMHFVDPIQDMGFKRVGDSWTVPLQVGTHTDSTAPSLSTATEIPPMPEIPDDTKKAQGLLATLRDIRRETTKSLQVQKSSHGLLADIKGLLKSGSGGGGGTGGDGGGGKTGGGGRDGSGTGSAAGEGPLPKAIDLIADLTYKSGATIGEAAGLIRKISQEGRNPKLIASAVKDMKAELGPDAAKEFAQALKLLDLKTNASDAKRDAAIEEVKNLLKRTGGSGAGGDDKTKRQITGPLTGMLKDFKLYIASVQSPKYAKEWLKEITKQINMKGTSDKEELLIKQAMRDMAKVTNAKEAHKATDEFRRAIAHWEETLKKQENPLGVRRSEREWADLALKNAPRLPGGRTHINPNPHNRPVRVRIDRKHMDEQAAYQTNYSGFAS